MSENDKGIKLGTSIFDRPVCHPSVYVACHLCGLMNASNDPSMSFLYIQFLPKPFVAICYGCKTNSG